MKFYFTRLIGIVKVIFNFDNLLHCFHMLETKARSVTLRKHFINSGFSALQLNESTSDMKIWSTSSKFLILIVIILAKYFHIIKYFSYCYNQ